MAAVSDADYISPSCDLRTGREVCCQRNGHKRPRVPDRGSARLIAHAEITHIGDHKAGRSERASQVAGKPRCFERAGRMRTWTSAVQRVSHPTDEDLFAGARVWRPAIPSTDRPCR
jgi:hypothetical protein